MMTRDADKKREQMMMFSMDDMVPKDHMLRKIDRAIDWNFIYDLVEDKYCADNGRPSMDPVMLIKIPFIQYLYGIKSMRQTIKEIEVNVAYRWFLGLDMLDPVPHFSTFGKNYTRRFKDTVSASAAGWSAGIWWMLLRQRRNASGWKPGIRKLTECF